MTAPPWADRDWREHAVASITEGFCPERRGHGPLKLDTGGMTFTSYHGPTVTGFSSGGFCSRCQIWWRTEWDESLGGVCVVANYPIPRPAYPPYEISCKSAPTVPHDAETTAPVADGFVAGTLVTDL